MNNLAGFLRINRGSIEGYKKPSDTPIYMKGSGYENAKNWRMPNTLKPPARFNTVMAQSQPRKRSGIITDYAQYRKICPLDSRIKKII